MRVSLSKNIHQENNNLFFKFRIVRLYEAHFRYVAMRCVTNASLAAACKTVMARVAIHLFWYGA